MLAIITGSGFYTLDGLSDGVQRSVMTAWGMIEVTEARWGDTDTRVLFLPRHGPDHSIAPHLINYRGNIAGLAEAGATAIVTTAVSGGIRADLEPGAFTLIDDFIDFTSGRPTTFFEAPGDVRHTSVDRPYSPQLQQRLVTAAETVGVSLNDGAVYAATNGPRFETRAEIRAMQRMGADLVGMTGCPEVVLANELDVPYASLGVIVNWAAGLADVELSLDEIWAAVADAKPRVESIFGALIESWEDLT